MSATRCAKLILCSYNEFSGKPGSPEFEACLRDATRNFSYTPLIAELPDATFNTYVECLEAEPMSAKQAEFCYGVLVDLSRPRKPFEPGK